MGTTTFTGPVVSLNGFVGDIDLPAALEVTSLTVDTTTTLTGAVTASSTMAVTGAITATGGVVGALTGNVTGNVTGNATGALNGVLGGVTPAAATVTNLTSSGAVVGGTQALTTVGGAGVVNVTTLTTKLTSTGTDALSLANGTDGQLKSIVMVVDGGDATLTPTTKTGFTTIVFSAVGQSVLLQYFTTVGWMIISNNGAAAS